MMRDDRNKSRHNQQYTDDGLVKIKRIRMLNGKALRDHIYQNRISFKN